MTDKIVYLVFFAVFSLFMTFYMFGAARRARFQAALRRRLGNFNSEKELLLKSEDEVPRIERLISESGLDWTIKAFITRSIFAGAAGLLAGAYFGGVPLAILLTIVGLLAVPFFVSRARDKRIALCDQQMPQALEVMALALRAGHPLPAAVAIAANEAPSPIADELRRSVDENDLGRPLGDVLIGLSKRLKGCEAVHTFVVAVLVLQQTGGNLIAVIDRIVESSRARSQYHSKLKALTSEGRMSAKLLGALPAVFGILASMVDPNFTKFIFGDPAGGIIIAITLGLWLIGVAWTRRLIRTGT